MSPYYVIKLPGGTYYYHGLGYPRTNAQRFGSRMDAAVEMARGARAPAMRDARIVKVARKPRQVFEAYQVKIERGFTRSSTYTELTVRLYGAGPDGCGPYTLKVKP